MKREVNSLLIIQGREIINNKIMIYKFINQKPEEEEEKEEEEEEEEEEKGGSCGCK